MLGLVKPPGCSSHDAVALVRKQTGRSAGHLGTLDPLAAGVLVVAYGRATRLIRYAEGMDKEYNAEVWLGRRSPSEDFGSPLEHGADASWVTREDVERVLSKHLGTRPQRPPAYSARQVGGQRAYRAARAGEPIDLPARPATLYAWSVDAFAAGKLAKLRLSLHVGAGFYVRSLARDLGDEMGTGGVLAALVRTRSGFLRLDDCQAFEEPWQPQPPGILLSHLPVVALSDAEARRIVQGQRLPGAGALGPHRAECRGRLIGVVVGDEAGVWHPQTVLGMED
ncbi:MAG: tRNA pseudouridine(55) synthase TruB [Thermaerobacter sp.]|nr:tRNA pseudouridine(55) synthase TruB [Thermaerobacter sp.]